MKGGADLLRAEIKNCIVCTDTVSLRQLLLLTCLAFALPLFETIMSYPMGRCQPPGHNSVFTISRKSKYNSPSIAGRREGVEVMFSIIAKVCVHLIIDGFLQII